MRAVVISVVILGCFVDAASADVREELILDVARVAVNEAGFSSPADVALVWQVVESRGRDDAARLAWLRRHSPCPLVATHQLSARERLGNCIWTRQLTSSDVKPEHFPSTSRWRPGRWPRVLRLVRRLVEGTERRRPCAETPSTWGGPMDEARALERGLRRLYCTDTLNDGYTERS